MHDEWTQRCEWTPEQVFQPRKDQTKPITNQKTARAENSTDVSYLYDRV